MASIRRLAGDVPSGQSFDFIDALTDRAKVFLFSYSPHIRSLVSWSANGREVLGVSDAEIAGSGNLFLRHVHPDDRFLLLTELDRALTSGTPYRATYRWLRPDSGEMRWLHCRGELRGREDPSTPLFEGLIMDLSDELRGGQSAALSPDSVASMLAAFSTTVCVLDRDLRILRIRRPESQSDFNFGDSEFRHDAFRVGRLLPACFVDSAIRDEFCQGLTAVLRDAATRIRRRIITENHIYSLELSAICEGEVVSGVLCFACQITELVHMEQRLAALERSEGLARLASGVAHHFNNVLQAILGQAAVIEQHSERLDLVKTSSAMIGELVRRASSLSQQLFFVEPSEAEASNEVDLNVLVVNASQNLGELLSRGERLAVTLGSPPLVRGIDALLIDAITAILRNAAESSDDTGLVTVQTSDVHLQSGEVEQLPGGRYARVTVADRGRGMTSADQAKALDPFFTTKAATSGGSAGPLQPKGLGLTRAFATVRRFGGALSLRSIAGKGTTVSLYLPESRNSVKARPDTVPLTDSAGGKVLVVDDDPLVLETVTAILRGGGFGCLSVQDSREVRDVVLEHGEKIEVAIVDAVMPNLSGPVLIRRLRRWAPHIQVIGFSGAAPTHTDQLLEAGAILVLRKPVEPAELLDAVAKVVPKQRAA